MICDCRNTIHIKPKDVYIVKQADTMDATATAEDILEGATAYSKNVKLEGAIIRQTAENVVLDNKDDIYTIPAGYHNGNGTVAMSQTEVGKLVPENIVEGVTLFGVSGSAVLTNDATAQEASVLNGETFYAGGYKRYGAMPNNGATTLSVSNRDDVVAIPQGYHNGSGYIKIADEETVKIVPENILNGVSILGVIGSVVPQTPDRLSGYINGTLTHLDLSGDDISNIRDYLFYNETALVSVKLPDGVFEIGAYSFNGCSNLVEITLSEHLEQISTAAFWNCIRLASIELPEELAYIGSSAFRNTSLSKIWIPKSVTVISSPGRANSPFYECSGLTDIYCEAESQPPGFASYWNFTDSTTRATVHWGVSKEEYEEL